MTTLASVATSCAQSEVLCTYILSSHQLEHMEKVVWQFTKQPFGTQSQMEGYSIPTKRQLKLCTLVLSVSWYSSIKRKL